VNTQPTTAQPYADGTIQYRANRTTGTMISVIDTRRDQTHTFDETEGGRWISSCDDHDYAIQHATKRAALDAATHPDEWCGVCARITTGEHDDWAGYSSSYLIGN